MNYKQFIRSNSLAALFIEPEAGWEAVADGDIKQLELIPDSSIASEFSIIFVNDASYGNYIWTGGYIYNTAGGNKGHIYNKDSDSLAEGTNEDLGDLNIASGIRSHAEGIGTVASGNYSLSIGYYTNALGEASHAEGLETESHAAYSHAEGYKSVTKFIDETITSPIEFIGYMCTPDHPNYDPYEFDREDLEFFEGSSQESSFLYALQIENTEAGSADPISNIPNLIGSLLFKDDEGLEYLGKIVNAARCRESHYNERIYFSLDTSLIYNVSSVWRCTTTHITSGFGAHAEGGETYTEGTYAHAEGQSTTASGWASHTEGCNTNATLSYTHAEGYATNATLYYAHAEGTYTSASGESSHAEGYESDAINNYAHAEGYYTTASGYGSHAEGNTTTALGQASHAEGTGGNVTLFLVWWKPETGNTRLYYSSNRSGGSASDSALNFLAGSDFASDAWNSASDITEKYRIENTNKFAGWIGRTLYNADGSVLGVITRFPDKSQGESGEWFIIDRGAQISENILVSAYIKTGAAGESSHSEGYLSDAAGKYSHAEGERTRVTGTAAHGEGTKTQAYGAYSHAEGEQTQALAFGSHSEGKYTHAEGEYTHVEGYDTKASGLYAHSEGIHSSAQGEGSHAEGYNCTTDGNTTYKETKHKVILDSIRNQSITLRYVGDEDLDHFENYFNTLRTILLKNQNDRSEKIYLINCVVDHTDGDYIYLKINPDVRQGASAIKLDVYSIDATYDVFKEVTTVAAHAEGKDTTAAQTASHAEGINTRADGDAAHAEGIDSKALSKYAHAEGVNTFINEHSEGSHTEGYETQINSNYSHAEGWKTFVQSREEFVNRNAKVKILSYNSTTHHIVLELFEGDLNSLRHTFDERKQSSVLLRPILYEGELVIKLHNFIEYSTNNNTIELAPRYDVWGSGEKEDQSGIKGDISLNISDYPNAIFQVRRNEYFGFSAHAEGGETYTEGTYSHAEGEHTRALKQSAHAEGYYADASGEYSHAEGVKTETKNYAEHAQGFRNVSHKVSNDYGNKENTLFSVGAGGNYIEVYKGEPEFIGYFKSTNDWRNQVNWQYYSGSDKTARLEYCLITERGEWPTPDIADIENLVGSQLFSDDEKKQYLGTVIAAARYDLTDPNKASARIYLALDKYVSVALWGDGAISCWRVEKSDETEFIYTGGEDRSNALEITQNGDIYIRGAGDFNGDNINEAQTLQQVLKNLDPSTLNPLFETISAALNNLNDKLIALDTVVSATLVNHENRLQNLETTYEIPKP